MNPSSNASSSSSSPSSSGSSSDSSTSSVSGNSSTSSSSNVTAFLSKLWRLVNDSDHDELICWSPVSTLDAHLRVSPCCATASFINSVSFACVCACVVEPALDTSPDTPSERAVSCSSRRLQASDTRAQVLATRFASLVVAFGALIVANCASFREYCTCS